MAARQPFLKEGVLTRSKASEKLLNHPLHESERAASLIPWPNHFTRDFAARHGYLLEDVKDIPLPPTRRSRQVKVNQIGLVPAPAPVQQDTASVNAVVVQGQDAIASVSMRSVGASCSTTASTPLGIANAYLAASKQLEQLTLLEISSVIDDDDLMVDQESQAVEILLHWMDGQSGPKMDVPIFYNLSLLGKIRWRGVDEMYIRRRLVDNPRVSSDPAIREFLHRVLDFLSGGSPFAGLVTIHRPMTGIERCVFIVGAVTETSVSSEVIRLSLQRPEASMCDRVATQIKREAAACVCTRTNALFVSGIGFGYKEIWQWTGVGGWNRCDDMNQGRRRHSMVFANETSLYIFAGSAGAHFGVLGSVEKYDTRKECCLLVGDLVCPVDSAACIADFSVVYVFGGGDKDGNPVNHVQAFDTTRNVCSLLTQSLPRPLKLLRAVVWDRLVIVTSLESCFLYHLERQLWYPRPQFRSGCIHYGCVVENQRLYIFGGWNNVRDPNTGVFTWILSDQVRYVPVADIVEDKPAQWMGVAHHRLPIPCLVHAYAAVTAATGPRK